MSACRECRQPVSTEAQACPHCGAAQPTGAAARRSANRTLFLIFVAIAIISAVAFAYERNGQQDAEACARENIDRIVAGLPERDC